MRAFIFSFYNLTHNHFKKDGAGDPNIIQIYMKNHAVNVKIFSLFIFNGTDLMHCFIMFRYFFNAQTYFAVFLFFLRFLHYYSEFMLAEKTCFRR